MTAEQFAYWLQGFTELNPSMEQPTAEQWKSITEHLNTVFVKVTPPVKLSPTDSIQEAIRRYREEEQIYLWPPFLPNSPAVQIAPVITC